MKGQRKPRAVAVCLFVLILAARVTTHAQEVYIQAPLQYQLFMKILKYDRNLLTKGGNELAIGIVYQGGFRSSYLAMEDFRKAMNEAEEKQFGDLPIRVVLIDLDKQADFEAGILTNKVSVLYVTPLRAFELARITSLSRARKIVTLTAVADYVAKGISVGLGLKDERPEIIVNLQASREEGADLSSNLLKLARVIR